MCLPNEALERLAALLSLCEQRAVFPKAMTQWKIVFLPKKKTRLPTPGDVRPIAVGSAIYRAWSRVRFGQVARALSTALDTYQAGQVRGLDAESLLVAAELEFFFGEVPRRTGSRLC